jgi:hypothetical protein
VASANPLLGSWANEDETLGLRFEEQRVTITRNGEGLTSWYQVKSVEGDRMTVMILEPGSQTKTTTVYFTVNGARLRMNNPQSGEIASLVRVAEATD